MGIKVAELNTLSDAKGITGIRFFNEMEDTHESTNLRKLADVWMSKNRCCQGHRNRSAVSVTRITVDIGRPSQEEEVNPHRFRSQICRKMSVFTKLHGHKTIEVEFRIRVERPFKNFKNNPHAQKLFVIIIGSGLKSASSFYV